jgi:hypothetical protein
MIKGSIEINNLTIAIAFIDKVDISIIDRKRKLAVKQIIIPSFSTFSPSDIKQLILGKRKYILLRNFRSILLLNAKYYNFHTILDTNS